MKIRLLNCAIYGGKLGGNRNLVGKRGRGKGPATNRVEVAENGGSVYFHFVSLPRKSALM